MFVRDFDLHLMIQLELDSHRFIFYPNGSGVITPRPVPLRPDPAVTVVIYTCDQLLPGPVIHQPASLTDIDSDND